MKNIFFIDRGISLKSSQIFFVTGTKSSQFSFFCLIDAFKGRHDIQHYDIPNNNTQHKGIIVTLSINDTQHKGIIVTHSINDTQHKYHSA
jgi:hypothetical protein